MGLDNAKLAAIICLDVDVLADLANNSMLTADELRDQIRLVHRQKEVAICCCRESKTRAGQQVNRRTTRRTSLEGQVMQTNPRDVVVSQRFGASVAYHVCVDGQPELWEQGFSEGEAIERLAITHGVVVGAVRHRGLVTQDLRDWPER